MKVLITGFDSFGNETINPSNLAVNSLPDSIGDIIIKKSQYLLFSRKALRFWKSI